MTDFGLDHYIPRGELITNSKYVYEISKVENYRRKVQKGKQIALLSQDVSQSVQPRSTYDVIILATSLCFFQRH